MDETIAIIERLGSLGILVLMVWRAPAIISSIKELLNSVTDKVAALQSQTLDIYIKQQETERNMMAQRFEALDRSMEKIGQALDASMKTQTEILHRVDRLERMES